MQKRGEVPKWLDAPNIFLGTGLVVGLSGLFDLYDLHWHLPPGQWAGIAVAFLGLGAWILPWHKKQVGAGLIALVLAAFAIVTLTPGRSRVSTDLVESLTAISAWLLIRASLRGAERE